MVTAVFTDNDDCARTYGLWQWDYGQQLRIEGLHLPTAVEIHFALQETGGEAITRVGTTKDGVTTVTIPDSMLEGNRATWTADKAYNIYAWVYLSDKSSGETIKRITMQVKSRPKPEAFEAPGDGEIFHEAIEAVNDAAKRAEEAGDKAIAAADEAEKAATQTAEHLQAVQGLAEQVETNADTVAQDKQTVTGMLSQTQQAASDAALSAQEAKLSETAAAQAQTGAEAAEDGARQYAEETGADRQAVANDKQTVTQMREAVAADRQAVEQTALQFGQTSQDALTAIGQAQSTAVGAVKAEGNKQTTAVQEAGTQAVREVAEAKTTAVQAVTTEGDTQTKRVQDAAAGIVADREQIAANKQAIESKVDKQQGADNAGKALVVGKDGNVELGDAQTKTDPTLTQPGQAADAQVTGREIATLHQGKADAIVETAQGETVILTDSSDKLFEGLRVFGKSTQDGTPSVENPVPIVSAGESGTINVSISDSGSQSQSLTLATPNGLPGVPVSKDGNYTDADGQQWVCDEIDLERGKYVQRVAIEKNNGGWELKPSSDTPGRFFQHNKLTNIFSIALKKSLCNIASFTSWGAPVNDKYAFALNGHGFYFSPPKGAEITAEELNAKLNSLSFPVVFVGELATPIERDLTPEEIAAYKALRTYSPTTVITNDAGAGMEATYVADTKAYIDKKFKELNQAIVNTQIALL